jgi:hypothetical protein
MAAVEDRNGKKIDEPDTYRNERSEPEKGYVADGGDVA